MKFSLSWLKDYLDTKLNAYEISDYLTNIGLEVEKVTDRSIELKPFTVAYVKKAEKHPNADRLKVCEVETNKGIYKVICGAPNARTGMKAIFAPEGSYIPGTNITLKKTNIRGVESAGMLVSEKEMGISDDHEGIIEVENSYKIGESFSEIYGFDDPVIEIGITPNRGDCLSVRGISRDLAAAGAGKLKNLKTSVYKGSFNSPIKWKILLDKKNEKLCPAVAGIYFKNVKNRTSPKWLQKRLISIGLRPISTLVDITNYITFDLGRPLHVFDADKINGDLTMRLAKHNEKIKALDGKTYDLSKEMIVIADKNKAHAIGGVMGGEESSCTENTTNVFLEVALFDPISIAKTGRKLGLKSDARFRFERGVDPYSLDWGISISTKMILDLCGGKASKLTIAGNYKIKEKNIKYTFSKVKTLGGINVKRNSQKSILKSLGFKVVNEKGDKCLIKIPSYRLDVIGEADIVEEILRVVGYNKIEPISVLKKQEDESRAINSDQFANYKSKRIIASRGYSEVITWSFMSSKIANYFNYYNNIVKIDNPISSDLDVMRPSIIPNLLDSVTKNQSKLFHNAGIFEVGPQYKNVDLEGQHMMVTGIKYGNINQSNWNNEERVVDVFDIKADLNYFLTSLGILIDNLQLEYQAPNWYHPGKSATLKLGKSVVGFFGEINPIALNLFKIKNTVCGFEIFLDLLGKFKSKKDNIKSFDNNPFQAVERDFAFIIDKSIKGEKIINCIKNTERALIKDIRIFDIFEGQNIPSDKKSVAIRIILQPKDKTFTDKDIENISNKIIANVKTTTGGDIRR
tara:strand:+ start:1459 stop:3861 length:2403 start_codon:yes stop_codon:yes gene_type:complete